MAEDRIDAAVVARGTRGTNHSFRQGSKDRAGAARSEQQDCYEPSSRRRQQAVEAQRAHLTR